MTNRFLEAIRLVLDTARRGGFRVALIGGFALPFYGVRRATGDVDFLVEATGADALDTALVSAGLRRIHRSKNAAHYAPSGRSPCPIDLLYARRPPSLAMLERAREQPLGRGKSSVPVVDVEAIIGLKVQAIANNPKRRRRDEDDIAALLERHAGEVDLALLREYFALFGKSDALDAILAEIRKTRR